MVPGRLPKSYTFVNVSEAETKGLEMMFAYDFGNGLNTELSWNELRTEDKKTGKDLEFNPDRTVAFKVDYSLNENLDFGLLATYVGEQHYTKVTPAGRADALTDTFTLVDLTTSYKFGQDKKYEVYGGVNNIFDGEVKNILGSNVGTYFYAGARVKF